MAASLHVSPPSGLIFDLCAGSAWETRTALRAGEFSVAAWILYWQSLFLSTAPIFMRRWPYWVLGFDCGRAAIGDLYCEKRALL